MTQTYPPTGLECLSLLTRLGEMETDDVAHAARPKLKTKIEPGFWARGDV